MAPVVSNGDHEDLCFLNAVEDAIRKPVDHLSSYGSMDSWSHLWRSLSVIGVSRFSQILFGSRMEPDPHRLYLALSLANTSSAGIPWTLPSSSC
jgi:hypothetical protein